MADTKLNPCIVKWNLFTCYLNSPPFGRAITIPLMGLWVYSSYFDTLTPLITRFMGPTWGPSGANRTQVDPCWTHELCFLGHLLLDIACIDPAGNPEVECHVLITRLFFQKSSQRTHNSSPVRVRYGMSFVSSYSNSCSASVSTVLYVKYHVIFDWVIMAPDYSLLNDNILV